MRVYSGCSCGLSHQAIAAHSQGKIVTFNHELHTFCILIEPMKKSTHATLAEVAKKAGVGTTTVSRVINGSHRVSPKTLARVQRVIESLGYTPNEAARTLKGRRSKTIGLVIPSIADPFFASCAEAAHAVARQNDSLLIVTTTHNEPRAEMESLNFLIRHRTDGLLISPANSSGSELRDLLHRTLIPVVAIVATMHEAVRQIPPGSGCGWFLSGPSKTADIEQSLVIGAQGARTLHVILEDVDAA